MSSGIKIGFLHNRNMKSKIKSMPDWSGIGSDLVAEIASRLQLLEDFIALRGVCRSWRAAGSRGFGSKSGTVPLLLLITNKYEGDEWELYSISKRKVYRKLSPPAKSRPSSAGFGWFIMKDRSSKVISLFDPFSDARIILPYSYDSGISLSTNPSKSSNFVLMKANTDCVCFWRPGDPDWTHAPIKDGVKKEEFWWDNVPYEDQIENCCYCNGKFYAIDKAANVWVLDPDMITDDHSSARFVTRLPEDIYKPKHHSYLVGSSDGKLIYITRECERVSRFYLYQIDVVKGECHEISGLGEDAIFIDSNSTLCVRASPPHMKPNSIYFTLGSCYCCKYDPRVYDIQDGYYEFFGVKSRANRARWVHSQTFSVLKRETLSASTPNMSND